jgi:hypothetical protein
MAGEPMEVEHDVYSMKVLSCSYFGLENEDKNEMMGFTTMQQILDFFK